MRARRGHRSRAALRALVLGAALTGCSAAVDPPSPPAPSPPGELEEDGSGAVAGLRLDVVLPAPISPGARAEISAQVGRVPALVGPELRAAVPAAPASPRVQAELVAVLADRAPGLLCVLGPDAAVLVERELVMTSQRTGWCASHVLADGPLPERVVGIELRAEELGAELGRSAARLTDGAVGVVLTAAELPHAALLAGLAAGVGDRRLERRELGDDRLAAVLDDLVAAGVEVVVLDPATEVTDPIPDGLTVLAPAHLADRLTPTDAVAVRWRVRWDLLLAEVVRARLDGDPGPVVADLSSGGFELDPAPGVPVG